MNLLDFMKKNSLRDEELAEQIGKCTAHAVKKWKYNERRPNADIIFRIKQISEGQVTLEDWVTSHNFPTISITTQKGEQYSSS